MKTPYGCLCKHEKQFANRIGTNARQGLENHPYSIFRKLIDRDNYCRSQMSFSLFSFIRLHIFDSHSRFSNPCLAFVPILFANCFSCLGIHKEWKYLVCSIWKSLRKYFDMHSDIFQSFILRKDCWKPPLQKGNSAGK